MRNHMDRDVRDRRHGISHETAWYPDLVSEPQPDAHRLWDLRQLPGPITDDASSLCPLVAYHAQGVGQVGATDVDDQAAPRGLDHRTETGRFRQGLIVERAAKVEGRRLEPSGFECIECPPCAFPDSGCGAKKSGDRKGQAAFRRWIGSRRDERAETVEYGAANLFWKA